MWRLSTEPSRTPGGRWERYYHEDLNRTNTKDIVGEAGEIWFATADRVIIYAHGKKELSFTHANWLPDLAPDLYYEFFGLRPSRRIHGYAGRQFHFSVIRYNCDHR